LEIIFFFCNLCWDTFKRSWEVDFLEDFSKSIVSDGVSGSFPYLGQFLLVFMCPSWKIKGNTITTEILLKHREEKKHN
jgi:hypothetical protein